MSPARLVGWSLAVIAGSIAVMTCVVAGMFIAGLVQMVMR